MKKRVLVILPDGVSLRNYVYTRFSDIALREGLELVYWNNTPLDLTSLGYQEIKFPEVQLHWRTDALKNAIIHSELNSYKEVTGDSIFEQYKFPWSTHGLKNKFKTFIAKRYLKTKPSQEAIVRLREKLKRQERRTSYYQICKKQIQEINPAIVFCASQRSIAMVAPMEAAKELKIPTVCAVFSWDNLPKATLVVEADHYLVWSEHMAQELANYYPFTSASKVHITGTPQFENHYDKEILLSRDAFFRTYQLDTQKEYLCFSGDDETTSPYDPQYLADVAEAVNRYNADREPKIGIIFRRCPVDFSDRYDWVLKKFTDSIVPIVPLWKSVGSQWDKKIPTKADLDLQANIAHHTKLVVNVGSSMVFDYAAHHTPCAYFNYNPEGSDTAVKDIHTIYKFIHFLSMPTREAVIWIDKKESILKVLIAVIKEQNYNLKPTQQWFKKIVHHPAADSSKHIVETFVKLK